MRSFKYSILLILFLIALVNSIILSFPPENVVAFEGCESIADSEYILYSNIGYYGIGLFSLGILFSFLARRNFGNLNKFLVYFLILAGALFSGYLFYIQYGIIQKSCFYINILFASSVISVIILLFSRRRYKKFVRRR
jgi:uncharacterized membrane protein